MQKTGIYILLSVLMLAASVNRLCSQGNDYYSLKDVLKNRYDRLEISNEKEAEQFVRDAVKLNFVSSIKISGNVDADAVLRAASGLDELYELQLRQYKGKLPVSLLDSLKYVENVSIYGGEESIPQIENLATLPSLRSLSIFFDEKIETFGFLKPFKKLNSLTLVGDFLPRHLEAIVAEVKSFPVMNTLGLSVDRLTDLPKNLAMAKMVATLNLYDNLSRSTGNGIEDLAAEHFEVVYDKEDDMSKGISINYYSDNNALSSFERDRLIAIWGGELYNAIPKQESDESNISDSIATEIPFEPAPVIAFRKNEAFSQPYELIKPEEEHFAIDPAVASVIHTRSGLNALIPANAFTDASGNTPAETVYISITSINNQPELLFSGAPMKAGNYQNPEYYCSKIMFNIAASTAKNDLKLKEGEQVKIEYNSLSDSIASDYFLDEESKSWFDLKVYYYSDAGLKPQDFYNLKQNSSSRHYYHLDNSDFNTRYRSADHYFLNDKGNANQLLYKKGKLYTDLEKTWQKPDKSAVSVRIKRGKNLVKLQKLSPKNAKKGYVYFRIFDKNEGRLFPELKPFLKFDFIYPVVNDKREFSRDYLSQRKYYDVRIDYKKGEDFCLVSLKTDNGFKLLKAYITIETDVKKAAKQKQKFVKLYSRYRAALGDREAAFNKDLAERFASYRTFFDSREEASVKNKQLREMKIRELGAFATLYLAKPEGNIELLPSFTDLNGLPIDVKEVYVLQKNMNTVQVFKPGNLVLDIPNTNMIVVNDFSGGLYFLAQDMLKSMTLLNNSLVYLKMSHLPPTVKTVQDFITFTHYKN